MPNFAKASILPLFAALTWAGLSASHAVQCEACAKALPISGLCPAEAAKLMPAIDPSFVEGLKVFDCKPVLQEVRMFGDALLYYGADCGKGPVKLEASAGAHSGSLTVLGGGMGLHNGEPYDRGKILAIDPKNPTASLVRWARQSMKGEGGYDAAYIAKCNARKLDGTSDAWAVDIFTNQNLPKNADGPRIDCGLFGYTEESSAYWRVAHGFAWFADFGQDAYKDYDFSSLTVITNANGKWQPLPASGEVSTSSAPAAKPAVTPAKQSSSARVQNIAGGEEKLYGEARGWIVSTGMVNGRAAYCVGERGYSDTKLRLGWDGQQWQLAVPYGVNPDYYGQFEVDGKTWDMRGTSDGKWAYGWIGEQELAQIRNGNMMILDIARSSIDFELIGTAAAILKIQECVERIN